MWHRYLSEDAGDEEVDEEDTSGHLIAELVLWTFFALFLSSAVISFRHRVPWMPLSGLMMLGGLFIRCVCVYFGQMRETVELMDDISAEAILLIFLPALIAECAISLDWYTFKREFMQIALLASTAVVLSSALTAVAIKYILGYHEFNWYSLMMLGAIFSATDHVSVVAILKEVKADDRLQTLLQGETLLNDGTVLVLFTTMMSSSLGSSTTADSLVSLFCRLSLGGIGLGLAFSLVLSLWLYRVVNHVVLETLLTLVCAYLLFYTAEIKSVRVSGGIATVTFGLYMSAFGKTFISPRIEHSVHLFWKFFGTIAESLILMLGGALLGSFFSDKENMKDRDVGAMFGLFALLHIVRALTIAVHWPILRFLGYGLTWRQAIALVFGAVKGTISIALALIAYQEAELDNRLRNATLFWAVGVSALGILVDSFILRKLVRFLGLESMSDVQENMLVSFTASLLDSTNNEIKKLKASHDYQQAKWKEVELDCGFDLSSSSKSMLLSMVTATRIGKKMLRTSTSGFRDQKEIIDIFSIAALIPSSDITLETRRRFFTTLKKTYWHRFEKGECFRSSALALIESVDRSLDTVTKEMGDWEYVRSVLLPAKRMKLLWYFSRFPVIGTPCRKVAYWYLARAYDVARNFSKSHEETKELLDKTDIAINESIYDDVMKESEREIHEAQHFLITEITDLYPSVCHYVQTFQVRSCLLYSELSKVEKAHKQGIITKLEYSELIKYVRNKIARLEHGVWPYAPDVKAMLWSFDLFDHFSSEEIDHTISTITEKSLEKGEKLVITRNSGVYMVMKGRVKEVVEENTVEHTFGDLVGMQHVLLGYARDDIEFEAVVSTRVVLIPTDELETLRLKPHFEAKLWHYCMRKAITMFKYHFGDLGSLRPEKVAELLTYCKLVEHREGDDVPLQVGTIMLCGSLSNGLTGFNYIPKGTAGIKATSSCIVFVFGSDLSAELEKLDLRNALSKLASQQHSRQFRMSQKIRVRPPPYSEAFKSKVFRTKYEPMASVASSEGDEPLLVKVN